MCARPAFAPIRCAASSVNAHIKAKTRSFDTPKLARPDRFFCDRGHEIRTKKSVDELFRSWPFTAFTSKNAALLAEAGTRSAFAQMHRGDAGWAGRGGGVLLGVPSVAVSGEHDDMLASSHPDLAGARSQEPSTRSLLIRGCGDEALEALRYLTQAATFRPRGSETEMNSSTLYEQNVHAWTQRQTQRLRAGKPAECPYRGEQIPNKD